MIYLFKSTAKLLILFQLLGIYSCSINKKVIMNSTENHALRLKPGEDLRQSIQEYVNLNHIQAGWMVTCSGSLTDYHIRLANQAVGSKRSGHFEIVSLSGTVSENGSHLHISVSDSTGQTIGGHLLEGCKIYTTAEIVLQSDSSLIFKREKDGTTPWEELQIEKRNRY